MTSGYSCIGLDNPKNDINIGAALRAAHLFNCSLMAVTGRRYSRHSSDVFVRHKHMPLLQVNDLHTVVPYDCVPVAIELVDGAVSLVDYQHPRSAFYVFGAEDNTLGSRVLSWCRDIVYIPTNGCLNLGMCVNVVLYDRLAKESRHDAE